MNIESLFKLQNQEAKALDLFIDRVKYSELTKSPSLELKGLDISLYKNNVDITNSIRISVSHLSNDGIFVMLNIALVPEDRTEDLSEYHTFYLFGYDAIELLDGKEVTKIENYSDNDEGSGDSFKLVLKALK